MALWRALEAWSLQVRREGGFVEVRTPALVRKELWETSGHWAHYQDNMFVFGDAEQQSGLKPMNCPESMLIFKTSLRSYRDLPMRLADYSWLFRNELTGALAGMFRVRQLTQDDSHVICREDQVIDEVQLALRLVRRQYEPFGFEPRFKLATRPAKKLGTDEFWDMAEGQLAEAAKNAGITYTIDPGGGAFYAPKIDVFIDDALGREWQMATVQIDYQLPQRFEMEYRAADGGTARPVDRALRDLRQLRALHRRHHGALRRRLPGVAGAGAGDGHPDRRPPRRVRGEACARRSSRPGLRAEVDDRSERMQAKLRDAQEQKVPVMLVLGDRDQEAGAVSPRLRTGESTQGIGLATFIADLTGRVERRELWPYAAEGDQP